MNELCGYANIGILSNMSSVIFKLLKQKQLIPDIAYTTEIVSAEIGLIKPSKEIFEYAANKMGLASKDIFFIDDTEINVKIAKSLDWKAFLFDTDNPIESIKKIKMQLPTIG
jgi:putative hydrolase of the HAD superfamily